MGAFFVGVDAPRSSSAAAAGSEGASAGAGAATSRGRRRRERERERERASGGGAGGGAAASDRAVPLGEEKEEEEEDDDVVAVGSLGVVAAPPAVVLEHPVVALPASLGAVACDVVNFALGAVAPRLLVPAIVEAWPAASRATLPAMHAVRTVHAAITALPRREVRDALPALFGVLMSALDARWRAIDCPADADAGATLPPAATVRAASHGSAVEVEVAAAVVALALKLSEAQLQPLLTRLLQWMAAPAGDIASDVTLEAVAGGGAGGSGGALPAPAVIAIAPLARRIAGYRVLAALSAALRSVFTPFFGAILPHLSRDLAALAPLRAAPTGAAPTPAAAAAAGGAGAGDDGGAGMAAALAAAAALDGEAYGARPVWHATAGAAGEAEYLVATGAHALRCGCLATLRSLLESDNEVDPGGFMASAKSGKARLDAVLAPLVRQFEVPLATSGGGGDGAAAAAAAPTPAKRTKTASAGAAAASAVAGVPGGRAGYRTFAGAYLVPVVGALVAATRRDTLWKPVNAALLLVTRDRAARVRLAALAAVAELFTRGSDEALVLLPETLPFLSELQHDDDTEVEAATHRLLRDLETRSGEDLQHYLN